VPQDKKNENELELGISRNQPKATKDSSRDK